MVWFLQLSLWSKILGLNLKEIKIWPFIVIIIDIDWYEKNYRDNFFGHIAQPFFNICNTTEYYCITFQYSVSAFVFSFMKKNWLRMKKRSGHLGVNT